MFRVHQNKKVGLRIYTPHRIAKMSLKDKQNAIDAIQSNKALTQKEKQINIKLLHDSIENQVTELMTLGEAKVYVNTSLNEDKGL